MRADHVEFLDQRSCRCTAGAAAAGGTFYILKVLQSLQLFYLAGQMNVANLPQNFRQTADSFSYTVLDIRLPWESAHSNSVSDSVPNTGFPSTPQGISNPGTFGPPTSSPSFFGLQSTQGISPFPSSLASIYGVPLRQLCTRPPAVLLARFISRERK